MKILLRASKEQEERFIKQLPEHVECLTNIDITSSSEADIIFDFNPDESVYPKQIPVIRDAMYINSKTETYYINTWPGFLDNSTWELGGKESENVKAVLNKIGKSIVFVEPETGLISARVISMIINEAYFALEDGVSKKPEIDIAMKLGTGYPFGPFEWSEKIGLKNIASLLNKLSATDNRYTPSKLLLQESAI